MTASNRADMKIWKLKSAEVMQLPLVALQIEGTPVQARTFSRCLSFCLFINMRQDGPTVEVNYFLVGKTRL